MRKQPVLILTGFILSLCVTLQASGNAANSPKTLKVKLNYTGAGTVDEKHKIYLLVFDANPFTCTSLIDSTGAAAPPAPAAGVCHILRRTSTDSKNGNITIADLGSSPVYAAAFLDEDGSYDGHSDPAQGSPMGTYGKAPDKPDPINLEDGKTVEITLPFDDSLKTP